MTCIEHDFSKVASVEAYKLGGSNALGFTAPIYVAALYDDKATVLGSGDSVKSTDYTIPFTRDTLKCSDKSSRSVAGITHQLTVSWETQPTTTDEYNMLLALQRDAYELVITYFGGYKKAIRTDSDAYSFDFADDNGTMKCTMTLTNGQGLTDLSATSTTAS